MNKFALLEELFTMVHTGEIKLQEDAADAERLILDIRKDVEAALKREIFEDITDKNTAFYAPEHDSWTDFLNFCNGNEDYAEVLGRYTEDELTSLWEGSHLADALAEKKIMEGIFHQVATLKMYSILLKKRYVSHSPKIQEVRRLEVMAKIKGFYSALYEQGSE